MSNSTKKALSLGLLICLVVPNLVFAAWWNPFSWSIFQSVFYKNERVPFYLENTLDNLQVVEQEKKLQNSTTSIVSTSTPIKLKENDGEIKIPSANNGDKKAIVIPNKIPLGIARDYKVLFSKLEENLTNFRDVILMEDERDTKTSDIQNKNQENHLLYLGDLESKLDSLLGKVVKKNSNEFDHLNQAYLNFFNEYQLEKTRYTNTLNTDRSGKEESLRLYKEQQISINEEWVRKIKIKIAEMNQLDTQINAYSGNVLLNILNSAKKLDGSPVFGSIQQGCGYNPVPYPYEGMWDSCKHFLHDFVNLYRSNLQVDLAKYQ